MSEMYPDFHSHSGSSPVLTVDACRYVSVPEDFGRLLTVGIHPWNSGEASSADLDTVRKAVSDPRVVAVGEIGIDPFRGAPVERQMELAAAQIGIARQAGLPVVFHIVRRYDLLLRLYRLRGSSDRPWAVHGFRGKPSVARKLASKGIYMSVGEWFNRDSVREIPSNLLLLETDDSTSELDSIAVRVAAVRGVAVNSVLALAGANMCRFYGIGGLSFRTVVQGK